MSPAAATDRREAEVGARAAVDRVTESVFSLMDSLAPDECQALLGKLVARYAEKSVDAPIQEEDEPLPLRKAVWVH